MQESENYEGIVVLGFPRSGTTLLRRLLHGHPAICCPPETHLFSACARFLREDCFAEGLSTGVVPGLGFSGIREEAVLERLRDLTFGFLREIRDQSGKRRWAEKSAFDSFHLDAIERVCGERCRYLVLFRHALDVVASLKDLVDTMETYLPELHEYVSRYPSYLQAFAHAWSDVNRRLLRFVADHSAHCHALRYEDLVAAPSAHLDRLFTFLGEPTDVEAAIAQAMRKPGAIGLGDWKTYETNQIHALQVGRGKRFSPSTVADLAGIVNPVLEAIGYERLHVDPPLRGEDARRRYQQRRMIARLHLARPEESS